MRQDARALGRAAGSELELPEAYLPAAWVLEAVGDMAAQDRALWLRPARAASAQFAP